MDLDELKKLCDEYDAEKGSYPEHYYEGQAVYEFAVERAAKKIEHERLIASRGKGVIHG